MSVPTKEEREAWRRQAGSWPLAGSLPPPVMALLSALEEVERERDEASASCKRAWADRLAAVEDLGTVAERAATEASAERDAALAAATTSENRYTETLEECARQIWEHANGPDEVEAFVRAAVLAERQAWIGSQCGQLGRRRGNAKKRGICSYCGRKVKAEPCKFKDRHNP